MPVTTRSRAAKVAQERIEAAERLLPPPRKEKAAAVEGDYEGEMDETRVVTRARSRKARRDAAASDAAAAAKAAGRHISSLGDDLLLEIFLRLPSLATLVRAAYTCRSWRRAVASSPAFRRRFRALHRPPLLGLFVDSHNVPSFPSFVPARPHDRDLAAAVRGGDFFLTSLQDRPEEAPCWKIMGCSAGSVLLANFDDKLLALVNPLTRQKERVIDPPPQDVYLQDLDIGMMCSDEDQMSFHLTCLSLDDSRIQATIFSSGTGVWSATPSVEIPVMADSDTLEQLNMFSGYGFVFVVHAPWSCIISLDTATMEFSMAKLPQRLNRSFGFGETKDGTECIVYSDGSNIGVLLHMRNANGIHRWVEDKVISMGTELKRVLSSQFDDEFELHVLEVCDGYAYLTTSAMDTGTQNPCWFLSLCLETMKLEKLFRRKFDRYVHLYFMPWPPSLLGKCEKFAREDAPV